MTGRNVNLLAERFNLDDPDRIEEVSIDFGFDEQGRLAASSDCARGCVQRALPADIKAGNLPCPNGHGSAAWSVGS